MIGLIFSLDYEIYGSGAGDFDELMIRPTDRMLEIFDAHGAKLTIMAEVAEILALSRYPEYHATLAAIEDQLCRAVAHGHDVQLHLHPAWFKARHEQGRWHLAFDEYALVKLASGQIHAYLEQGKRYLEDLLRPVDPDYRCLAFRAGNWLIQPSRDVISALEDLGFLYDSSVFMGGFGRIGEFEMDYRRVPDNLMPWVVDEGEITHAAHRDGLVEVPIYSRQALITSMITLRRLRLQWKLRKGARASADSEHGLGKGQQELHLDPYRPKKFDFCRLGLREMRRYLRLAVDATAGSDECIPLVAIGHSTEFIDDGVLEGFLSHVESLSQGEVNWETFRGLGDAPSGVRRIAKGGAS